MNSKKPRPDSKQSARAAAPTTAGFIGFSAFETTGYVASDTSVDTSITATDNSDPFYTGDDGDFRTVMKKLHKKDVTTKLKGYQELSSLISLREKPVLREFLSVYAHSYLTLGLHNDRRVRAGAQNILIDFVHAGMKKSFLPLLDKVLPSLWCAANDSSKEVASAASSCMSNLFAGTEKVMDAIEIYAEPLFGTILSNMTKSAAELTDMRVASEEEAEERRLRVQANCLDSIAALVSLSAAYSTHSYPALYKRLMETCTSRAVWKLLLSPASTSRRSAYRLLISCLRQGMQLVCSLHGSSRIPVLRDHLAAVAFGGAIADNAAANQIVAWELASLAAAKSPASFGIYVDDNPDFLSVVRSTALESQLCSDEEFFRDTLAPSLDVVKQMLPKVVLSMRNGAYGHLPVLTERVIELCASLPVRVLAADLGASRHSKPFNTFSTSLLRAVLASFAATGENLIPNSAYGTVMKLFGDLCVIFLSRVSKKLEHGVVTQDIAEALFALLVYASGVSVSEYESFVPDKAWAARLTALVDDIHHDLSGVSAHPVFRKAVAIQCSSAIQRILDIASKREPASSLLLVADWLLDQVEAWSRRCAALQLLNACRFFISMFDVPPTSRPHTWKRVAINILDELLCHLAGSPSPEVDLIGCLEEVARVIPSEDVTTVQMGHLVSALERQSSASAGEELNVWLAYGPPLLRCYMRWNTGAPAAIVLAACHAVLATNHPDSEILVASNLSKAPSVFSVAFECFGKLSDDVAHEAAGLHACSVLVDCACHQASVAPDIARKTLLEMLRCGFLTSSAIQEFIDIAAAALNASDELFAFYVGVMSDWGTVDRNNAGMCVHALSHLLLAKWLSLPNHLLAPGMLELFKSFPVEMADVLDIGVDKLDKLDPCAHLDTTMDAWVAPSYLLVGRIMSMMDALGWPVSAFAQLCMERLHLLEYEVKEFQVVRLVCFCSWLDDTKFRAAVLQVVRSVDKFGIRWLCAFVHQSLLVLQRAMGDGCNELLEIGVVELLNDPLLCPVATSNVSPQLLPQTVLLSLAAACSAMLQEARQYVRADSSCMDVLLRLVDPSAPMMFNIVSGLCHHIPAFKQFALQQIADTTVFDGSLPQLLMLQQVSLADTFGTANRLLEAVVQICDSIERCCPESLVCQWSQVASLCCALEVVGNGQPSGEADYAILRASHIALRPMDLSDQLAPTHCRYTLLVLTAAVRLSLVEVVITVRQHIWATMYRELSLCSSATLSGTVSSSTLQTRFSALLVLVPVLALEIESSKLLQEKLAGSTFISNIPSPHAFSQICSYIACSYDTDTCSSPLTRTAADLMLQSVHYVLLLQRAGVVPPLPESMQASASLKIAGQLLQHFQMVSRHHHEYLGAFLGCIAAFAGSCMMLEPVDAVINAPHFQELLFQLAQSLNSPVATAMSSSSYESFIASDNALKAPEARGGFTGLLASTTESLLSWVGINPALESACAPDAAQIVRPTQAFEMYATPSAHPDVIATMQELLCMLPVTATGLPTTEECEQHTTDLPTCIPSSIAKIIADSDMLAVFVAAGDSLAGVGTGSSAGDTDSLRVAITYVEAWLAALEWIHALPDYLKCTCQDHVFSRAMGAFVDIRSVVGSALFALIHKSIDATILTRRLCVVAELFVYRLCDTAPRVLADCVNSMPRGVQLEVERYFTDKVTPRLFDRISRELRNGPDVACKETVAIAPWATRDPSLQKPCEDVQELLRVIDDNGKNILTPQLSATGFHASMDRSTGEITAKYTRADIEATLQVRIVLPLCFPLKRPSILCDQRMGITEDRWRRWELQIFNLLVAQDGSVADAISLWKASIDKEFEGVEPCPICFSVLHMTNHRLPRTSCPTCKNKFHGECIYKWFESSHESKCPMCRQQFR